jgi:hypothetical protein
MLSEVNRGVTRGQTGRRSKDFYGFEARQVFQNELIGAMAA